MSDMTEPVRRRELAEQAALVPPNEAFIGHVTGTAFHITLTRHMVRALATVEQGITHGLEFNRLHVSEPNRWALERRGLVKLLGAGPRGRRFEGENPRLWSDVYEITRAGSLVLELLAEAQLVEPRALRHPLPPPPPGWLDPRPRLRVTSSGCDVLPSQRSEAEGALL